MNFLKEKFLRHVSTLILKKTNAQRMAQKSSRILEM
jgi:hypothetical protein